MYDHETQSPGETGADQPDRDEQVRERLQGFRSGAQAELKPPQALVEAGARQVARLAGTESTLVVLRWCGPDEPAARRAFRSAMTDRLPHCVRTVDTIGELEDGSFVVVLVNSGPEDGAAVSRRLAGMSAGAGAMDVPVAAPGMAVYPDDGATFTRLLGIALDRAVVSTDPGAAEQPIFPLRRSLPLAG